MGEWVQRTATKNKTGSHIWPCCAPEHRALHALRRGGMARPKALPAPRLKKKKATTPGPGACPQRPNLRARELRRLNLHVKCT